MCQLKHGPTVISLELERQVLHASLCLKTSNSMDLYRGPSMSTLEWSVNPPLRNHRRLHEPGPKLTDLYRKSGMSTLE